MKYIILFTNSPIDYKQGQSVLEPIFPGIEVGETYTYYGSAPRSITLDIDLEREEDSIEPLPQEMKERIPLNNPYCATLNFHMENMAKKVVAALSSIYPEMFVYEDQLDWYGTAKEFLDLDYNKMR